jgi:hypothetical protein
MYCKNVCMHRSCYAVTEGTACFLFLFFTFPTIFHYISCVCFFSIPRMVSRVFRRGTRYVVCFNNIIILYNRGETRFLSYFFYLGGGRGEVRYEGGKGNRQDLG